MTIQDLEKVRRLVQVLEDQNTLLLNNVRMFTWLTFFLEVIFYIWSICHCLIAIFHISSIKRSLVSLIIILVYDRSGQSY